MIDFYIYKSALRDFLRFRRVAIWLVVALGLFAACKFYVGLNPGSNPADMYPLLANLLVFRVLPLAAAIFSSAVVSQEVEQKTIVYLLTRPVPRKKLILMRTLASMTAVVVVAAFSAVAASIAVYGGEALSNKYLHRDLIAIVVGATAYGSLFVFLSLLINRAMIVCLLFAFAWETVVPSLPGSVHYLSITSYLNAIAERPSAGGLEDNGALGSLAGLLGKSEMSTSTGWIAMALLVGVCTFALTWWFNNFEFTPREDAE